MREALVTVFGLGRLRPAPGSWGSLPPVAIAWGLVSLIGPHWTVHVSLVLFGGVFAIACLRLGSWAEARYGRKDPREVVADEVAGQCVALVALPWRMPEEWVWNALVAATAFLAFRFFDIVKPPPARGLERLPAGAGILIDDLIAGVYALAIAQLVCRFVWPLVL